MKKEIIRLVALLVFGAAAITGCSIENQGHRGYRYNHDRHYRDRNHNYDRNNNYDRDHSYHNGY
ncbi:hypothetical protein DYU05_16315 [Mucilaginibacter terrenus]|uniref:Lipoprotein n=1 Tax=Mucilaginibacter terrenus TaxID=2482727 RepID=A0A3E2NMK8_9SPHI|nr:hypothetical protein [Mucilaginibacter terrenus]RFZ82183.1 hypothetical protein DYU05_16315 [Mucilaginibacter terrenus]